MFRATLLVAASLAVQAPPPVEVPVVALEAARGDPILFAKMLVHAGVPVGIEVRRDDQRRTGTKSSPTWVGENMEKTAQELRAAPQVSLSSVIDTFNSTDKKYAAVLVDGVVVIRPHTGRLDFLDVLAPQPQCAGLPCNDLMSLAAGLFAPWDPSLVLGSFVGGSFLQPPGVKIDRGDIAGLKIDTAGKTVMEVLNEAVTRVPGQGWMVVTTEGALPELAEVAIIHRAFTSSGRRNTLAPPEPPSDAQDAAQRSR